MVKYFKAYTLQAEKDAKIDKEIGPNEVESLNELMDEFDPESDRTDAIIYYLLTNEDPMDVMQGWLIHKDEDDIAPNDVGDINL